MARTRKAPRDAQYAFTRTSIGVHIDGAYGQEHAKDKMANDLLATVERRSSDEKLKNAAAELVDEWTEDPEDNDWDEWLDDATEVLQDATAPGLTWDWDAGDLILRDDNDEEE